MGHKSHKTPKAMREDPEIMTPDCRVLMFDDFSAVQLMAGEYQLTLMTKVEDLKVHPGEPGQAQLTNCRMIWYLPNSPWINISVGYRTVRSFRFSHSIKGESLQLKCQDPVGNYEFLFGSPSDGSFGLFKRALRNYEGSVLLREQRLRSSLVGHDGNFELLPGESVVLTQDNLANFSGEVAKTGQGIVTNFRFCWMGEIVTNFNVSVPLILLPEIRTQTSKRFGRIFYLRFASAGAHYTYGFTSMPEQRLVDFALAFDGVRRAALREPLLTLPIAVPPTTEEPMLPVVSPRNLEVIGMAPSDPALAYIPFDASEAETARASLAFDVEIGLAFEEPPNDIGRLSGRWKMVLALPTLDVQSV